MRIQYKCEKYSIGLYLIIANLNTFFYEATKTFLATKNFKSTHLLTKQLCNNLWNKITAYGVCKNTSGIDRHQRYMNFDHWYNVKFGDKKNSVLSILSG